MNMILHGIEAPSIVHTNTLSENLSDIQDQHLRDFQDNEKSIPTVLTTSQKLFTGVDARNVRNIVLMRPINKARIVSRRIIADCLGAPGRAS